jgi:hypothetical protein
MSHTRGLRKRRPSPFGCSPNSPICSFGAPLARRLRSGFPARTAVRPRNEVIAVTAGRSSFWRRRTGVRPTGFGPWFRIGMERSGSRGIAPGDYDRFEFDQDEDGYHLDEACLGGFASKAACPAFRVRR